MSKEEARQLARKLIIAEVFEWDKEKQCYYISNDTYYDISQLPTACRSGGL